MQTVKLIIFIFLVLTSCNNITNNNKINNSSTIAFDSMKNSKYGKVCLSNVKELLTWYRGKYDELNNIDLVKLEGNGDSIHYEIDFKSVKLYLQKLKESKIFSENYIKAMYNYLKKCNEKLIKNYQSDGPPLGLEHDLILLTQEPDYLFYNIDKLNYKKRMKGNNCIVVVDKNLKIEFNEKLLIEKIYR